MLDTLRLSLPFILLKQVGHIQLPCTEIFHLITRVHESVPLKMYLRPQVGTEEMYGFHCIDFLETHNYSTTFFVV
jgi:hypothetical protein